VKGFVLFFVFLLLFLMAKLAHSASKGSSNIADILTWLWLELEFDEFGLCP